MRDKILHVIIMITVNTTSVKPLYNCRERRVDWKQVCEAR